MRWFLLAALLGVLLLIPNLLAVLGAVLAWVLAQPVLLAFGLGLAARPHLPTIRRWAR
ncbi:hypothetical protein HEP81_06527 [Streptomyces griseofuscus]|uniref:Uncharacterized protein n=1 Tax=Streptomyces griseofuscus TaxID=146922 RepID=A0A7H1Q8Y2_9ACTN|nr:hypothetical protein [Streptomyces griseofuscus]QNT96762.1 hypothetical protein HEP81_06527 [Streptomyces griseofuscus]